jgi:hypothetical protein
MIAFFEFEGTGRKWPWRFSGDYPGIVLEELRKTTENVQ